jgi:elongation factor Tu
MSTDFHEIETKVRYLTTEVGGRSTGVWSGYRGQFFYQGEDYDGLQYFPGLPDGAMVTLGRPVRAFIRFRQKLWDDVHSKWITVGMPFQIREGNRTVGHGTVTKCDSTKGP